MSGIRAVLIALQRQRMLSASRLLSNNTIMLKALYAPHVIFNYRRKLFIEIAFDQAPLTYTNSKT